jgi:hypothetical protein
MEGSRKRTFGIQKMLRNSWIVTQLAVSQKGPISIELVTYSYISLFGYFISYDKYIDTHVYFIKFKSGYDSHEGRWKQTL